MNITTDNNNALTEKVVLIRKVAKVVTGGRKFSFSALVVVGNGKGTVGFGKGDAKEVQSALAKAVRDAQKRLITVPLKHGGTFYHSVAADFKAASVLLKPARPGTGLIAGGTMRKVLEALGITDGCGKSLRSNNPHTVIEATFRALSSMRSPKMVAMNRDKTIEEILGKNITSSKNKKIHGLR